MPEVDEGQLDAFRKWKEKHVFPEHTLAMQKDLRDFKEKFGVDYPSNFHCPWCFTGRLYENEDEGFYVCRSCQIRFKLECLDKDILDQEIARKKRERKERRDKSKTDKKLGDLLDTLTVESLQTGKITCQGCSQKIPPDVEYCTCGWKNPLVGLGDD